MDKSWSVIIRSLIQDLEIRSLIQDLESPDPEIRKRALGTAQRYAQAGRDISEAVPALKTMVGYKSGSIREEAAAALTFHFAHRNRWLSIEILLGSEKFTIRYGAFNALKAWVFADGSIAPLVETLEALANGSKPYYDPDATTPLCVHWLNTGCTERVQGFLQSKDDVLRKNMLISLVHVWQKEKYADYILPILIQALGDSDTEIRYAVVANMANALNGRAPPIPDPASLIAALEKTLHDPTQSLDGGPRRNAARALALLACYGFDIEPALPQLLKLVLSDSDGKVRLNSLTTLDWFVEKAGSIEKLGRLDRLLAGCLPIRLVIGCGNDPKKLWIEQEIKTGVVRLSQKIAKAKAALAKRNDGVLLAGETLPKPTTNRGGKVYRTNTLRSG